MKNEIEIIIIDISFANSYSLKVPKDLEKIFEGLRIFEFHTHMVGCVCGNFYFYFSF